MRLTGSFQTTTIHGRSTSSVSSCSGSRTRTGASIVWLTIPLCRADAASLAPLAVVTSDAGRRTDRKPPFRFAAFTRVGFSDTDAQGIVYYGRYLPYFDTARVEYLRELDLLDAEHQFVMRAVAIEYHAPAVFDDLVEVFVRLARIGTSSATYEFAAYRAADDVLMVTATQTLVCVDLEERRPLAISDDYRARVAAFEGDALVSPSTS